jgi:hypothetical protein
MEAAFPCTCQRLARGAGEPAAATVRQIESTRTEVFTDKRVEPGDLVQIEWENTFVLGEVRTCRPDGAGYCLEVEIEHLLRPRELTQLLRVLLEP